jgi:4-amino-4-deoxy-L-arabinose transferase-like glycosyltransferase
MLKFWPDFTRKQWLIILCLGALYFTTRLYHLTAFPIFVDEAIYSRWAQISLHDASWRFISLTDGKQPLWVWASMLPLKIFRDPLFATRLTSTFSGFLTLLGVIYTGHLLGNKKLGLFAGFLVLISPFLFFYDRFAVMESMLAASGVWVMNIGILLALSLRLDIALLLGLAGGLALLVKSPALIYLLLIPISYPFLTNAKIISKKTAHFLLLFVVSCVLAAGIYNIQRLSPWMHMISAKNGDFVISPLTMLKEHPFRIWQNFADSQMWLWSYVSVPVYLVALGGGLLLLKENWRRFFLVSAWFWGPLMATVMTAMLFRPRYIVFITPFLLLYAAYGISRIPSRLIQLILVVVLTFLPLRFMVQAWFDPLNLPLIQADWDYRAGWAAGRGVKEIAAWLVDRAHQTSSDVGVYTEGTFGLLPHGLELYVDGQANNLKITGVYPLDHIPPTTVVTAGKKNTETYFILNNTQVTEVPSGLEEIQSYAKADGSLIRLYRVLP